ncbi:hypothetical protein GXW78_15055 [Roseomonas terrae]|uniref:Uncharacterized protein n=1 Tax=Neoroseomonas terrae TaxID=424799 RepID=A0ABS5EJ54_9PROT|nr:hypothetical protein [Neoroseomonas terrae]MBR0650990.1 hypothetical protein [Neoroseomonas terrae]
MIDDVPGIPWVQPLVLALLLFGGLALRRWGSGRAPAIGMALLGSRSASPPAGSPGV